MTTLNDHFRDYYAPLLLAGFVLSAAAAIGLAAVRQPMLALVALLALPLGLTVLFWPDFVTLVVIFGLYTNAPVVGVKFHGIPYTVGAAFPILLIFPLAVILLIRRQKLVFTPLMPVLIVFLGIQLLGALFSRDPSVSANNITVFMIEGIGLYFLIVNSVRTPAMLRRAVWALLLAGVLIGGIPLYQQVTGTFENNYGGFAQISEGTIRTGEENLQGDVRQPRLAGPIGEQNRYAQIMLMLVPLGLSRFWGERRVALKGLALIATGVIALGMALAFSRGAAVGFVLMLLSMVFTRNLKLRQFGAILLTGVLLLAAFPQYGMRLTSLIGVTELVSGTNTAAEDPDGAIRGRATAMLGAVYAFVDHPVIGVGPGMVKYYTREYGNRLGIRTLTEDREAHSLYLGIAADNGALGLLSFLAILYVTLRGLARMRKRWVKARPDLTNLATGLLLALVAYLATGIFLHLSYARYFWLVMALANAAVFIASELEMEAPAPIETASVPPSAWITAAVEGTER